MRGAPVPFVPEGIFTALVTCFHDDGALDLPTLRKTVAFQVAHGAHGVVPLGGTGEPLSLTVDEHKRVIDAVAEEAAGRLQVIVGALLASQADIIATARHAARAGADAVMLIPPYFVMLKPAHLKRHLMEVAAAVPLPLVLYHGPQRSGVRLDVDTLLDLVAAIPSLSAVKDTTGDVYFLSNLVRQAPASFSVLQGWDELVYPTLALGGRGAVLSLGCLVPRMILAIHRAFAAGDLARARELQYQLLPLCDVIYSEPNPAPLKKALAMVGRPAGPTRPPLYSVSTGTVERLERLLPAFAGFVE
jgi:4-hydroxy-tetrahydrodipicolinate synthase